MRVFFLLERRENAMTDTASRISSLKKVYSFFGPPGSGKGTVAREAVRRLSYQMLSTGDLLRAEVAKESDLGKQIRDIVNRGALVSDEIVTTLVFDALKKAAVSVLILDGYPRTRTQAEIFLREFPKQFPGVDFSVIHFDLADSEIYKRLASRLICERKTCQATYALKDGLSVNDACSSCGARLVRRNDDAESVIRDRLKEYAFHAAATLSEYKKVGVKVCRLDLVGKPEGVVFQEFIIQCTT